MKTRSFVLWEVIVLFRIIATPAAVVAETTLVIIKEEEPKTTLVIIKEEEEPAEEDSSNGYCDESKCRTIDPTALPGYWWLPPPDSDQAYGYTCWGSTNTTTTTITDSFPCAEGYQGRPTTRTRNDNGNELIWYTCCANPSSDETPIESSCSDEHCDPSASSCWAAPDGLAPKRCMDGLIPRNTGAVVDMDHGGQIYQLEQFLCCNNDDDAVEEKEHSSDGESGDINADLLPDVCSTETCTSLNGRKGGPGDCWADGITEPFTCDPNSDYPHPTRNGHDDLNMFNFHYVCCKTKEEGNPYIAAELEDGGLTAALTIQAVISFVTFLLTSIFALGILVNVKARQQSWNLYLVLLAIPDSLYNLFRFSYAIVVIERHNTFVQTTWLIDWFYAVANLLLNAVIVYQVHAFLLSFRQARVRRKSELTCRMVVLQAFGVYVVAAGCGLWMFYLHTVGNDIAGGSHNKFLDIHKISLCCMVIPPVVFVVAVCFSVWYQNLLPRADKRTRTLTRYFLRVIYVFLLTWLPYLILVTQGLRSSRVLGYIGMCLSSLQGTLSVVVALTKPDILWSFESFLTCQWNAEPPTDSKTYCCGCIVSPTAVSTRRLRRGKAVHVSGLKDSKIISKSSQLRVSTLKETNESVQLETPESTGNRELTTDIEQNPQVPASRTMEAGTFWEEDESFYL